MENSWSKFYQDIRDSSWPNCYNEYHFRQLPKHIQQEIIDVHDGQKYLMLTHEQVADFQELTATVNFGNDLEKFFVNDDFAIYYSHNNNGGGTTFGQRFPLVIKYCYPDRVFETCLEWCSGPGFIGFRLLNDGLCKTLTLQDCNQGSIDQCQITINCMPQRYHGHVNAVCCDKIAKISSSKKFDLVVGNPPHINRTILTNGSASRIARDHEWKIHQEFFANIGKLLAPNGVIVLVEDSAYSSPQDFEHFITQGGLRIVHSVFERSNPQNWFLILEQAS